jgi:integrase/recombinase XerD
MTRNTMSNTIAGRPGHPAGRVDAASLYAPSGGRKYLNQAERQRALAVMASLEPDQALFALTLAWTGARVSETLELMPVSFQIESGIVAIRTLKRRKHHIREVPIPPGLMAALDQHFGLTAAQLSPESACARLWPRHRVTGWRIIKGVMMLSQIIGNAACPRGLRHSFGVGTLQAGVPLNITQRWLGHARISTTAIYADACGPDELVFAIRFWRLSEERLHASQEP